MTKVQAKSLNQRYINLALSDLVAIFFFSTLSIVLIFPVTVLYKDSSYLRIGLALLSLIAFTGYYCLFFYFILHYISLFSKWFAEFFKAHFKGLAVVAGLILVLLLIGGLYLTFGTSKTIELIVPPLIVLIVGAIGVFVWNEFVKPKAKKATKNKHEQTR